jgi:hypothetical protein
VQSAVLFIETVRGFDFAHFLARGDIDAQHPFDLVLLGRRGLEEIEPHGVVRQRFTGRYGEAVEAGGARHEYVQQGGALVGAVLGGRQIIE